MEMAVVYTNTKLDMLYIIVWLRPRVRARTHTHARHVARLEKCLDAVAFCSVMSGVITGPHFIRFFGGPDAIQVGTMVAVLEIGAFS